MSPLPSRLDIITMASDAGPDDGTRIPAAGQLRAAEPKYAGPQQPGVLARAGVIGRLARKCCPCMWQFVLPPGPSQCGVQPSAHPAHNTLSHLSSCGGAPPCTASTAGCRSWLELLGIFSMLRWQQSTPVVPPLRLRSSLQCINRWLSVRLELLGISVVFGTAVLVAVAAPRSAGLAGLALTSALSLTGCALLRVALHFSMVRAVCTWMARAGCSARHSVQ